MKHVLVWIVALGGLSSCSQQTTLPVATDSTAEAAKSLWPEITTAQLNEGRLLYEKHCGSCHSLYTPSSVSREEWKRVVPPMATKARIDKITEERILHYVTSFSVNERVNK